MTETSRAIAEALELLQTGSLAEREGAVRVLSGATADEAVAGLVIALEDADAGIREFAADALAQISGETTSLLLSEFLGAENIRTRNLAAEILVRIGSAAVPALIGWIGHEHHDVRKFVVDVLGLIGDAAAAEAVCGALWDDNINVSCSAAEALGLLAEPSSCEALIGAAEKRAEIRPQAIEALGRIKDPRSVEFLVGFLSSADPLLMYAAAEALGQIGSPQALKALSAVVNDTSVEVAEEAFKSALRISESIRVNLTDHISGERMRRFVIDGLINADEDILTFALRTNEIWHDAGLVAGVISRAQEIEASVLQRMVANFKRLRVQFYEPLFAAMEDADAATLNLYLEILKDCHIHQYLDRLVKYSKHEDAEVRQNVAAVLGRSGSAETLDSLLGLTKDVSGGVRAQAFMALGWIGDSRAINVLIQGLKDEYPDVREVCVGALVTIGGRVVIDQFTADLEHDMPERQRLAAAALGWIGEEETIEPLLRATRHRSPVVRKEALQAVSRLNVCPEYDDLIVLLNDEDSSVQRVAISALARHYPERAIDVLRQYLQDDDVWLRLHIVTALRQIGTPSAVTLMKEQAADGSIELRVAAISALADTLDQSHTVFLIQLDARGNEDVAEARDAALKQLEGVSGHEPAQHPGG